MPIIRYHTIVTMEVRTLRTVLLTGFEPFGSYQANPTEAVVKELDGKHVAEGVTIVGAILPCSYERAPRIAIDLIGRYDPAAVLSLGYASRVKKITVETCGHNRQQSPYFDCDNRWRDGVKITGSGPKEVQTTGPNYLICQYLRAEGIGTNLSDDAEGFVCNTLIYNIALHVREFSPVSPTPFTYIHTPTTDRFFYLVSGTDKTVIPHDDLARSALIALRVMLDPDDCDDAIAPSTSATDGAFYFPFGSQKPGVFRRSLRVIGSDSAGA